MTVKKVPLAGLRFHTAWVKSAPAEARWACGEVARRSAKAAAPGAGAGGLRGCRTGSRTGRFACDREPERAGAVFHVPSGAAAEARNAPEAFIHRHTYH